MKRYTIYTYLLVGTLGLASCGKDFLNKLPQGQLSEPQVGNKEGVEGSLLGAYSILNGNISGTWGNYASAPSQWLFGEVASDNAHKGSESSDQPYMANIESYKATSVNDNLSTMWQVYYEGVLRCNNTLKLLADDQNGSKEITEARAKQIQGEARVLRAHYYFYLWRVFKKIPYLDENTTTEQSLTISNEADVMPKIEEDLNFGVANLTNEKYNNDAGRMNKRAAQAYLGKVLLYNKKYAEALPLFNQVMAGTDLTSMPYWDNFDVTKENGPEAIFVSKHAINSNGNAENGNVGDMLSGLSGTAPVNCCGFYQPTIDLVNSFKVNASGLPIFDNGYRTSPYLSDFKEANKASYELNVDLAFDPRLDYTVGRRGVQYLDWGVMPGDGWIREVASGGPFVGIKTMVPKTLFGVETAPGEYYITSLDVNIIRLADVYLMAAECEVEAGSLPNALKLVNAVRNRAAKLAPKKTGTGVNAAKYNVKPYLSFPDKAYAQKAVRFERRLELAMEGHRFFDLVRWGIAKQTLESYSSFEGSHIPAYKGLVFNSNNEFWPIPQEEIDRNSNLKQNQ